MANSVLAIYGPQPQVLQGWFETPGIQLGPVYLDSQYLLIIAVTIVLVIFNYWFFEHTLLGKKLQATSQDKEMALAARISVSTMIMITFIYSAVLGGLAGILVAPVLFVSIQMGSTIALKSLCGHHHRRLRRRRRARSSAGWRSGVIETFGAAYVSVPYKDGFAFLVLVLFLIFRRKVSSANVSRRKHERSQRQYADGRDRDPHQAAAAAAPARISSAQPSWWRLPP